MALSTDEDGSFTSRDLVRTFAVRAGAAVVILALVTGFAAAMIVSAVMRAESVRVSSVAADALLRHELVGVPLDRPVPAGVAQRIDEVRELDLSKNGITAIRIWDRRGNLLYSSVDSDRVGTGRASAEVARAMAGETVTRISRADAPDETPAWAGSRRVVEVFRPLREGAVVELSQSFSPIAANIERTRNLAWLGLLGLAIPAYLIELQIVRKAARKLDRQESALAESNERLAGSLSDLEEHTLGTLSALAATVDAKDSYTARHSLMVADYAAAIARRLGLDEGDMRVLEQACLLHDIGKIAVPESILLKAGSLDAHEFGVIKDHATKGAEIVASIPFLRPAADAVRHHHERCDGQGYPDGLAGDEIGLLARIIAVADTFDAITSSRPYRPARSTEEALLELRECSSTQLCPTVVQAFMDALEAGEIKVGERHLRAAS